MRTACSPDSINDLDQMQESEAPSGISEASVLLNQVLLRLVIEIAVADMTWYLLENFLSR